MASLLEKAGDAPHLLTGHMDSTTKHRENIMKKLFNGDPMIKYDTQMDRMKQLNWKLWFSASNRGFHGLCSLHPNLELRHSNWELDSRAGWEKKPYEKHVHQLQCGPSQLCFGGLQPPFTRDFLYFLYLISYNYHKPGNLVIRRQLMTWCISYKATWLSFGGITCLLFGDWERGRQISGVFGGPKSYRKYFSVHIKWYVVIINHGSTVSPCFNVIA